MASRLVVSISHVEFTETEQTFYVVKVQQDADEWQVRRAYTDFRHLRDDVHRVLKDDRHQVVGDDASRAFAKAFHELPFPGKRLFGSKSDRVVKERAVELHHFLIKLLFLTHTYRKAQKQLYEPEGTGDVNVSSSSLVTRPHGSASVFYLLRDFLKPTLARSSHDGLLTTTKSGAGNGSDRMRSKSSRVRGPGGARTDGDNDDDSDEQHAHARRMLRESRMLAMRTSQQKSMSAPQLQSQSQSQRTRTNTNSSSNASTPRRAPPPRPARPMAPEAIAAASAAAAMEELTIEPVVRKSVHFQSNGTNSASPPHNATTATTTTTATYARSSSETGQLKPRTASSASVTKVVSPVSKRNSNSSTSTSTKRFNDRISTSSHHPVLRSIGSDLHIIESIPDPEPRSLSTSSTASSTASFQARSLETATALSSASGPLDNSIHSNSSSSSSARRRPRSKKKSMSMSSSSLSQAEKEMRDSQRLSRLTPQLTAQSITIDAQKELEKHVSEYNAIMIMRYVDRFISKAVGKTPGCYTVLGKRLVIDSARFVTELDDVFHDLPNDFQDMFKNASGEWVFPRALDAYVQLKWDSFQGKLSHGGSKSSHSSTRSSSKYKSSRSKGSDSDDSDSDYEFEDASGGYMKRKDRAFTQEESDVLQMMIADGTAGKDQMLRLRRQFDEKGWSRRTNPNAKFTHQASSGGDYDNASDTDEDDNGSSNESFRRFQQQQNAMRKSRMSRHDDTGGLV